MNHEETLGAEEASWVLADPRAQAEKLRRERMRHYKMARDLLLDKLDTADMDVLEVGGGPLPLSDTIPFRSRTVVEPLTEAYRRVAPCPDHVAAYAEDMPYLERFDLAICTNALDHVRSPETVVRRIALALRPGGYAAVLCAENNALTHPHPAHAHNVTAGFVHNVLDGDFETVWELNYREHGYRYGWVEHQGRRGQPAFALLMRRCTGF